MNIGKKLNETLFAAAIFTGVVASVAMYHDKEKRYWLGPFVGATAGVILNYTMQHGSD